MNSRPNRRHFRHEWGSVVLFMVLEIAVTFWVLLGPETQMQAAVGTAIASAVVGLIGWVFLRRERVPYKDVGLGARAWQVSLILFVVWWVLVTLIDLLGRWIAGLAGGTLAPFGTYAWSPATVVSMIGTFICVGFGEEIAFRAYLHNKLAATMGRKWPAILLAALLFGLWHTPADIVIGGGLIGPLINAVLFSLISLLFFNLPYEFTGLLPFLALYHGWQDFLLLLTFEAPTWVGIVAGYVLGLIGVWIATRWLKHTNKATTTGEPA